MDPITTAVIIGLLIVYIIIVYIVIHKLLSKRGMTNIPILVLLYIYGLVIAVALPISLLYDRIYHSHIYPFIDWLIYTYGR